MARKAGRNDPCPCGSGKKYKHCCLQKNNLMNFTHIKLERDSTLLKDELWNYLSSMQAEIERAHRVFAAHHADALENRPGFIKYNFLDNGFIEWFLFDYILPSGMTPFGEYIKKRKSGFGAISLEEIKKWEQVPLSILEVTDKIYENEYLLKDIFTKDTLTFFLPRFKEAMDEEIYLVLRAFPTGESHLGLFSVFAIPHLIKKRLHKVLLEKKDHSCDWPTYLRKNSTNILKLIGEQNILIEEQPLYMDIDISIAIKNLRDLYRSRKIFYTLEHDEFEGLTFLEAFWEPEIEEEFIKAFNKIDSNDIVWTFHFDDEILDRDNWNNMLYYYTALLLWDRMKKHYTPLEIEILISLWYEYSAHQEPIFRKPGVWAAALEYSLSYLNGSRSVRQRDVATKYRVSVSSVSKYHNRFLDYWTDFRYLQMLDNYPCQTALQYGMEVE